MNVPQLKELLQRYGVSPNKALGQHFLCDQRILETIAQCIQGDNVLEIGPGPGALTALLARQSGRHLVLWEKDAQFQPLIAELCPSALWIQRDAMDIPWEEYAGYWIASNLPYNISVPIMLNYASKAHSAKLGPAVFMMQKEVALRIMAKVNTSAYGRLSVMIQTFCHIQWVVNVPPAAFWPQPMVDSVVLQISPLPQQPGVLWNDLSGVVARAFSKRRKMIHHNMDLKPQEWQEVEIDRTRRAETLTIQEFEKLAEFCAAR